MDISLILTCHREGALVGPAIRSLQEAQAAAVEAGLSCEVVAVLDRADGITTESVREALPDAARIFETDFGDPGLSRNHGVASASGEFVAFLDGDDLWSFNWLVQAHRTLRAAEAPVVVHSEFICSFGETRHLWLHWDSRRDDFWPEYLTLANYWDAMSFARRELYVAHPFRVNALKSGYGHEDWLWNMETLKAGIHHVPAPQTIHFKRARPGTQMAACDAADVVVAPNALFQELRRKRLGW
jgi:glycosyltransferase involved in cell wall biosynthesis